MSSISVNHVVLAGYLTRDPESRTLTSGDTRCTMRLALNTTHQAQAGPRREKVHFFDIVVYGEQGDISAKWLRKGEPICVEGRLDYREWTTERGQRAQSIKVIAHSVQFLGRAPSDDPADLTTNSTSPHDTHTGQHVLEMFDLAA
jgi:single-strand DNA-binding protein